MAEAAAVPGAVPARRRAVLRRLLRDAKVVVGGGFILLLALALLAPWIAPTIRWPRTCSPACRPWVAGADPAYSLGTDSSAATCSRRLIFGARIALVVALVAALAHLPDRLGRSAFWPAATGGWVDLVISRLIDIWMSFPPVLLSILLDRGAGHRPAFGDPGAHPDRLDPLLPAWCAPRRWRRGAMDYVAAAQVAGMPRGRAPAGARSCPMCCRTDRGAADAGDGHRGDRRGDPVLRRTCRFPPTTPTWGGMIAEGRSSIHQAWWVLALPCWRRCS
ncbi:MAG: hypothetical protein KatS3mg118_3159 [Paracoccaceae bacterium]|nr:MAG: hypothetical protein KatS3mg118_3159 [Paracoccaceae bacterium]